MKNSIAVAFSELMLGFLKDFYDTEVDKAGEGYKMEYSVASARFLKSLFLSYSKERLERLPIATT